MKQAGIDYRQQVHVIATDLDPRCAHMAYVQLSMLHIPALVQVGNSITREVKDVWRTPAHVEGDWDRRLGIAD
jgi:hypothetical protein